MLAEMLLKQIECDSHNIQELVNLLPHAESKGEKRSIEATIKVLVKEIKQQKVLITDAIYDRPDKTSIPLFEVELPVQEIEICDLSSFFGEIS